MRSSRSCRRPRRPGLVVRALVVRALVVRALVGAALVVQALVGGSLVGSAVLPLGPGVASSGVSAPATGSGSRSGNGAAAGSAVVAEPVVRGRRDGAAPWVWPSGTGVVGRPWEEPPDDYSAGHRGIDVPAALGTPVVAVDDGVVAFAGPVGGRQVVTIDHGDGLVSTLDSVVPAVRAGDAVEQGDEVGTVSVGHCAATDPCLHLGARVDDRYVDPTPWLPAAEWPVLLPESAWPG
ncbi:peptidoglycan DD-metalloendopeptidase family protein [Curtobacterium sp. L1-20]|uniref:peptidoglycan DD-metalloendopeptidase family protein n=1 Tax=Curtobacterium sp. L1-20 TaxID=3138181 RepID=UPI003B524AE4